MCVCVCFLQCVLWFLVVLICSIVLNYTIIIMMKYFIIGYSRTLCLCENCSFDLCLLVLLNMMWACSFDFGPASYEVTCGCLLLSPHVCHLAKPPSMVVAQTKPETNYYTV